MKKTPNDSLSFGIVGYGSFGSLLARLIAPHADVTVYSRRELAMESLGNNVTLGNIIEVAKCDVVIVATELDGLDSICQQLAPLVAPQTIVMDVCSVKVLPAKILKKRLQKHCRVLATHPLFGPHSIGKGDSRGKIIAWHEVIGGPFPELEAFMRFKLGLEIVRTTPKAHDKEMAWVHGLTFFVGRGLLELSPPKLMLPTGYYKKLQELLEIENGHSYELFKTVQLGNPYTHDIRKKYITALQKIDRNIRNNLP